MFTDDETNGKPFTSRLAEAIGSRSGRSIASAAGISQSALRGYLTGENEPTRPVILAIARATQVSPAWLLTGEGEMRVDAGHSPNVTVAQAVDKTLFGKVLDAVAKAYKEADISLQTSALGEIAAGIYNELADVAADRAEWEGGLKVLIKRMQKDLLAPVGETGTSKRSA